MDMLGVRVSGLGPVETGVNRSLHWRIAVYACAGVSVFAAVRTGEVMADLRRRSYHQPHCV